MNQRICTRCNTRRPDTVRTCLKCGGSEYVSEGTALAPVTRQCVGTVKSGQQCGNMVTHGRYCHLHKPEKVIVRERPRFMSHVYWHFTGSPIGCDWGSFKCPQDIFDTAPEMKNEDQCVDTAQKILGSKKIMATCQDFEGAMPCCCVTDIPFKDLTFHSNCYGKVAIGFSAESIQKWFFPVMYCDENLFDNLSKTFKESGYSFPVDGPIPIPSEQKKIDSGLAGGSNLSMKAGAFAGALLGRKYGLLGMALGAIGGLAVGTICDEETKKREAKTIAEMAEKEYSKDSPEYIYLATLLNYVKRTKFSSDPYGSFYSEREWRCLGDFEFEPDDIAAIVCPEKYIKQFRETHADTINHSSIIAWETLELM